MLHPKIADAKLVKNKFKMKLIILKKKRSILYQSIYIKLFMIWQDTIE
jgi:hypothetical protein